MKIAIRADSGVVMGTGHVMRCLTLAEMLRTFGAEVHFIHRRLDGDLTNIIKAHGFDVHKLAEYAEYSSGSIKEVLKRMNENFVEDAEETIRILDRYGPFDWAIVDHYAFDIKWEKNISAYAKRIFVIDDMANRPHGCDVLLDQNFHFDMNSRYDGLLPEGCIKLLGPKYMLFRPEFRNIDIRKTRNGTICNLLVFFGGSDSTNETTKTLKALEQIKRTDLNIDVVVGGSNPHYLEVEQMCERVQGAVFHRQIDYMAELMNKADLAIGAGGSTTWERCLLGLPAIIIVLAENQKKGIEELEKHGAFINLGWYSSVNEETIGAYLRDLFDHPLRIVEMSNQAFKLVSRNSLCDEESWKEIFDGYI